MATFNDAFDITMKHEGGYSNDPDDVGGETCRGISRRYNPSWPGWVIIDATKPNINFKDLDVLVRDFYKAYYWDINRLDEITNQDVANEIFDVGVNIGVVRAVKFLQKALNYLNRNEHSYNDLVVDGKIGSATFKALKYILNHHDVDILLKIMNVLQGMHYLNYMKKSPTQEKYARGWFSRVELAELK